MRTITVVPYDEKWPEMFESESILIKKLLEEFIEHHLRLALIGQER